MTSMNGRFNKSLFSEDVQYMKGTLPKFLKSFGKSEKKIEDRVIGFWEEQHVRFQLLLVEWGRAKVIKICIMIIALLLFYVVILRHFGNFWKFVLGVPAIWYLWKWAFA